MILSGLQGERIRSDYHWDEVLKAALVSTVLEVVAELGFLLTPPNGTSIPHRSASLVLQLRRKIEGQPEARLARHISRIYPPMTQVISGGPRPPLFLAIAVYGPLFKQGRLNLVDQWLNESSRTEFYLCSGGGHGFGMHAQGTTGDN